MSRPGRRKTKRWKRKRQRIWQRIFARVTRAIESAILSAPKIPYTDAGIDIVVRAMRERIEAEGQLNGIAIVPGSVRVSAHVPEDPTLPISLDVTANSAPVIREVTIKGVVSV